MLVASYQHLRIWKANKACLCQTVTHMDHIDSFNKLVEAMED